MHSYIFIPQPRCKIEVAPQCSSRMLAAAPVPIELCPTSNLKTLQLGSLCDHPTMQHWLTVGYPVSISTDDSSVFCTTSARAVFSRVSSSSISSSSKSSSSESSPSISSSLGT